MQTQLVTDQNIADAYLVSSTLVTHADDPGYRYRPITDKLPGELPQRGRTASSCRVETTESGPCFHGSVFTDADPDPGPEPPVPASSLRIGKHHALTQLSGTEAHADRGRHDRLNQTLSVPGLSKESLGRHSLARSMVWCVWGVVG